MFRVVLTALGVILAVIALYFLSRDLPPPRSLVFAAGPEGGGYHQLAQRYRTLLARDGIEMELLETKGSAENARLLSEGVAQAGLLQGGVEPDSPIETLGAVFLEPIFVFVRTDARVPRNVAGWRGLSVAVGAEGSGTDAAARTLFLAAGLDRAAVDLRPLGGREAAEAVIAGEVDAAMFVAPISAPYLAPLFASERVEIARLDHLLTLSRRLPDSQITRLPSGAFSLDPPIPAEDLLMLTLAANLVADPDLHPALVDRLVEAARHIHGRRDILSDDGEFPTMIVTSLSQDPYARDLIEDGPSPLARFLPYWIVAQINRFAILLLPLLFIVLPLLRALPGLYVFRQRRRVFRHYSAIRAIDREAETTSDRSELERLAGRLDHIEGQITRLNLPLPYREYAYTARLHIDLIRKRISERLAEA